MATNLFGGRYSTPEYDTKIAAAKQRMRDIINGKTALAPRAKADAIADARERIYELQAEAHSAAMRLRRNPGKRVRYVRQLRADKLRTINEDLAEYRREAKSEGDASYYKSRRQRREIAASQDMREHDRRAARSFGPFVKLRGNPKRELSVPDKHQLKIARHTLRMPDDIANILGGPSKSESRDIIRRLTGKRSNPDLSSLVRHPMTKAVGLKVALVALAILAFRRINGPVGFGGPTSVGFGDPGDYEPPSHGPYGGTGRASGNGSPGAWPTAVGAGIRGYRDPVTNRWVPA